MLIRAPVRESRQIAKDLGRVRVKDVRPVAVNQNAVLIVIIEGVPADMRTLVADEYSLPGVTCETLRDRCTGEAATDNQVIEHDRRLSAERHACRRDCRRPLFCGCLEGRVQ